MASLQANATAPVLQPWWRSLHPYRHFGLALLLLGMASLIIALAALDAEGVSLHASAPLQQEEWSPLSPRALAQEIESVVRAYLEAPSAEACLAFVRRAQAVRPMMHEHGRRHPWKPIRVRDVHLVATLDATHREQALILASAETSGGRLIPLVLEQQNDRFLVDWESHVGYSPMKLDDFLQTPPGSEMWFRAYASRCDYYNYRFSEDSDTLCLRLTVPHTEEPCYAYLDRTHPQFVEFTRVLAEGQSVPLILTLRQESRESGDRRQLEVARLIQARWMIEETLDLYSASLAARAFLPDAR